MWNTHSLIQKLTWHKAQHLVLYMPAILSHMILLSIPSESDAHDEYSGVKQKLIGATMAELRRFSNIL